ncbi:hypothetical protein C499_13005 [Halogeometricum borinquense DSM 11551]|uniref:DUF8159 domain-containing protein n=2 Tax=Halogeometricum borinquense TaxID=60847 RepID=E4NUE6_HALBP|nr:hypothetical protein [Halogeometricum borinquense]ADQ68666.1 hypothetical protein Hbor_31310 [Halogeometricum borinquense DSM 11551]ELY25406.1 hypothetical protein C499_13005 [Halogeometricum borinquense DSM 11551]RYJ08617.1 hypothetical protein ELS19_19195 [Halogeometricum borinquense]
MKRRAFLVGLGTCGCASIAGCGASAPATEENTDGETTTEEATSTPTNNERRLAAFRSYITERNVTVKRLTLNGDKTAVSLRYLSKKSSYQELGGEIGMIAGGFFRQVDTEWDVERLDATVLQDADTPFGTWHANVSWYEQFQAGKLTGDELSLKVLQTLERPK